MIPTAVPNLSGNEAKYLQECITSTFVSTAGPFVSRFEAALSEVSGAGHAAALSSGTSALHLALTASGVGADDLVIVPALTFIASANAISHARAQPWLFDVTVDSWTLDLALCAQHLEQETQMRNGNCYHCESGRRVAALMPVLIMGNSVDISAFRLLADRYNLKLIIDSAAAIGATIGSQPVGQFGADALCFSFNGNKTVTCGGGGAIVSENKLIVERAAHLASTARTGRDYDHDEVGYNLRITNLEAAVGLAQMEQLPNFLSAKHKIAKTYADFADRYEILGSFPQARSIDSTHWFSGFWYRGGDATCALRFRTHCQDAGIDLRSFWKPLHLQRPYAECLRTAMPITDDLWQRIFAMPCSTHLSNHDLGYVLEVATGFWDQQA